MKSEERIQILKMIESGQVSADEGMKLLEAVEETTSEAVVPGSSAKWMRVKVREGDSTKVNVNLPIALLEVGLDIGMKFVPEEVRRERMKNIDLKQIMSMIKNGARGKLVEVEADGALVEIIVE